MTTIEPTQRDKDAASTAMLRMCNDDIATIKLAISIREGERDDHWLVQSYARHAAAERAIGYRMGIEAAAAKVQAEWPHDKRTLVPMIRALSDNAESLTQGSQQ